jgi:hypothetical protein
MAKNKEPKKSEAQEWKEYFQPPYTLNKNADPDEWMKNNEKECQRELAAKRVCDQSRKSHKLTDERRAEIEADVRRKYRPKEFAEEEAPRRAEQALRTSSSAAPDAKMEAAKEVRIIDEFLF